MRGAGAHVWPRIKRLFFGSRTVRELSAVVRRRDMPDVAHLAIFKETVLGPVQRDEALMLHGIVRTTRPRTVVEFGFLRGHSAFNFLTALDDGARLYSFDVNPACRARARSIVGRDPRFRLITKSQAAIGAADVDHRPVDFVFLDAAHDLELNRATFERLVPLLAPGALIAIHDTGTVPRALFPPSHWLLETDENWVGDEYEGQPGERAFVNWLLEEHPEFAQVHFHSTRTIRCGITLLQRTRPLPRPVTATPARAPALR